MRVCLSWGIFLPLEPPCPLSGRPAPAQNSKSCAEGKLPNQVVNFIETNFSGWRPIRKSIASTKRASILCTLTWSSKIMMPSGGR